MLRQADHRAADSLTLLHGAERGRKLAKRNLLTDDGAELAGREQGQELGVELFAKYAMRREVEATQALGAKTTGSSTYAWHTPTSEKFPNSTGRGTSPSSFQVIP